MGINIGAFLAPLVTGYLAQDLGFKAALGAAGLDPASSWHFGFAAAGVGMVLGLIVFLRQSQLLADAEAASRRTHIAAAVPVEANAWRDAVAIVAATGFSPG